MALGSEQVRRSFLERFRKARSVAHEYTPGCQRHEHHFVRIEDERVRPRKTAKPVTEAAAEGEAGSMCSVDVKPCALFPCDFRECDEVIKAPCGRRSCRTDKDELAETSLPGESEGSVAFLHVRTELSIERHFKHGIPSETQNRCRSRDRVVGLRSHNDGNPSLPLFRGMRFQRVAGCEQSR
jgi:hypothetical protein